MTAGVLPSLHDAGRVTRASGPVVADLFADHHPAAPVSAAQVPAAADGGRLPLGRLGGLVAGGGFALWTSLTCFVC